VTGEILAAGAVHGMGSTHPAPPAESLVDAQSPVSLAQGLAAVVADDVDLHDLVALPELAAVYLVALPALPTIGHVGPPCHRYRSVSAIRSFSCSQTPSTCPSIVGLANAPWTVSVVLVVPAWARMSPS